MALLIYLFTSDVFFSLYYLKLNTITLNKKYFNIEFNSYTKYSNYMHRKWFIYKNNNSTEKDQIKINPVEIILKYCIVFCKHSLHCHCIMFLVFWAINDYSHNILIECMAHINLVWLTYI